MALEFPLPDIGEGIHEGEIVRWLVPEGATVVEDDPVVEVMTDKATVEIPAPASGVVSRQLVAEGETAKVGSVLFVIEDGSAPASERAPAAAAAPPAADPVAAPVSTAPAAPAGGKVLAAPATRRLARELGVDLGAIPGTGPKGRIRPDDVRAAAQANAAPSASATAPPRAVPTPPSFPAFTDGHEVEEIPFRGIRRKTAEAMSRSKNTAAHFSVVEEVDCTELVAARARAREVAEGQGIKLTYMPYIMKAVAIGLQEFPQLNAELDEGKQIIRVKKYVNLGIAVDSPQGLVVPVVRDAHRKGLLQLAAELAEVAGRARSGALKPADFKDSTFSITNAGNLGGTLATPIINFPEVAILGVHAMRRLPRCVGEEILPRQVMNLSISIDHRLVDGADGVRFLVRVRDLLEAPALMLL